MSDDSLNEMLRRSKELRQAKEAELEKALQELINMTRHPRIPSKYRNSKTVFGLLERDGFKCRICGNPVSVDNFSIDHKTPLAKGGDNQLDNLQITHIKCNRLKSDKIDLSELLEYFKKRYGD